MACQELIKVVAGSANIWQLQGGLQANPLAYLQGLENPSTAPTKVWGAETAIIRAMLSRGTIERHLVSWDTRTAHEADHKILLFHNVCGVQDFTLHTVRSLLVAEMGLN